MITRRTVRWLCEDLVYTLYGHANTQAHTCTAPTVAEEAFLAATKTQAAL